MTELFIRAICSNLRILKVFSGVAFGAILMMASVFAVAQTSNVHSGGGLQRQLQTASMNALRNCTSQYTHQGSYKGHLRENLSTAGECVADHAISTAFHLTHDFLNQKGKAVFGAGFHIDNSLSYSLAGGNIQGDLDMVIPLHSFANRKGGLTVRSTFLQQGVTSWRDDGGFERNDMRVGAVHRFIFNQGKDMIGNFALLQENLESGHARLAVGMDYKGIWGEGTFTYFKPVTDWAFDRSTDNFLLRRPLEGVDVHLSLKPTATVTLGFTLGRWEDKDNVSRWKTKGLMKLGWQPHTWLNFAVEHGDTAFGGSTTTAVNATLRIPFGGKQARPSWKGLALGLARNNPSLDIWRSVESVRRIEYAERQPTEEETAATENSQMLDQLMQSAKLQFMQAQASSGENAALAVILDHAAPLDAIFVVVFSPGSGDNPAVSGEDYIDEAIEVVMRRGEVKATVSFKLPHNENIATPRTLKARIVSVHASDNRV